MKTRRLTYGQRDAWKKRRAYRAAGAWCRTVDIFWQLNPFRPLTLSNGRKLYFGLALTIEVEA